MGDQTKKKHGGLRMPKGGRPKGQPNKIAVQLESIVDRVKRVIEEGLTPVEYLLSVMRDEQVEMPLRIEAAKAASSYVHRKQPQDVDMTHHGMPSEVQIGTPLMPIPPTEDQ